MVVGGPLYCSWVSYGVRWNGGDNVDVLVCIKV